MSWLPILLLAAVTFVMAVYWLKLARSLWMLFGSAMLFGLAGYALQGNPGLAGAPSEPVAEDNTQTGELMVEARREFYPAGRMPSRFVVTADAFTRQGQHGQAANFLRNAVAENPSDGEAWVALGNALVEHADGHHSRSALCLSQAEQVAPERRADLFLGLSSCARASPEKRSACGANCWKRHLKKRTA